jgi:hypothetical protein
MPTPPAARAMARRTTQSVAGKASPPQASRQVRAAEAAVRRAMTLAELAHGLSRLTWSEIGLADQGPTPLDGGRSRNRFAALRPEVAAGRTALSRRTRVRAMTHLLREIRGLRAELAAKGWLTVTQLTHVRRVFGSYPDPLRDNFADLSGRSDQASTMLDALAIEEGLLVVMLKMVRRVPDPVPLLDLEQIRRLSIRQLLRLWAVARHEFNDHMLVLGLAAHSYETNPLRSCGHALDAGRTERGQGSALRRPLSLLLRTAGVLRPPSCRSRRGAGRSSRPTVTSCLRSDANASRGTCRKRRARRGRSHGRAPPVASPTARLVGTATEPVCTIASSRVSSKSSP